MYCEKCGTKLEEGAKFCPKCGTPALPVTPEPFQAPPKPKKKRSLAPVIIGIIIGGVIIVGILASIVLVSLGGARVKARDARRVADVRMVATALEMYYIDEGEKYPITESWYKLGTLLDPYFSTVSASFPVDPTNEYPCVYSYTSDGTDYVIAYCSEADDEIKTLSSYEYSW